MQWYVWFNKYIISVVANYVKIIEYPWYNPKEINRIKKVIKTNTLGVSPEMVATILDTIDYYDDETKNKIYDHLIKHFLTK